MPKNSRRKKRTRQHAARNDERYVRASRSIDAAAQKAYSDSAAGRVEELIAAARARTLGYVQRIQAVVEARGWQVPALGDIYLDAQGLAQTTDVMWEYPPAFGGADLDDDDWVVPQKPLCSLAWSDSPRGTRQMSIRVETAGNWNGCMQHRSVAREFAWSRAGVLQFVALLGGVESSSALLDPAPYIACLVDGPCGKLADDRADGLDPP